MSNTTPLSYRIDTKIKDEAETILNELGISPTSAIQMFYKQVILNNGIPFDVNLRNNKTLFYNTISEEDLYKELEKDLDGNKSYSKQEILNKLKKDLDI